MNVSPVHRRFLSWPLLAVLLVPLGYRVFNHPLHADEIETAHTAWKVLQGERIYVDFFQHHNPLFYFVLAPVIAICGDHAWTLIACRLFMLPFLGGMAWITFVFARRTFGPRTAALAVALLLVSTCFVTKALETRPDVPQAFFALLGLLFIYPRGGYPSALASFAAGLCLGVSFLFHQNAVLFSAALSVVLAWRIARGRMGVWSFAALVGGGLLILAPFAWWLLRYNDLQQYWFLNWTVNANLLARSTIVVGATRIVLFQTGVCVLAATYLTALPTGVKRREVLVLAFATGIAPWFMRPPYVEYWLCFFPFLAILAAAAFVRAGGLRSPPASALLAAVVLLPAATWSALVEVNPRIMTDLPEMQLAYQLRAIDFVVGVTAREECVYDGNAAFNVFRKDVDYFWFGYQDSDLLETCKSLRRVEFDPYALVARLRPKVIGTNLAANDGTGSSTNLVSPRDSRIRAHYLPSESFATLLVRRDGAATGEKGVRQAIGGKPRLNFVP